MMEHPKYLYHYTSLENLTLILTNRTLCFNSLLNVDDIEEAETEDLGTFGKYVFVSCWTDDMEESIALWKMYTPDMHGVRIRLPAFPFKKYCYKAGQLSFTCDTESYINVQRIFDENKACILAEMPHLIPVIYTDDEKLLRPKAYTSEESQERGIMPDGRSYEKHNSTKKYEISLLGKHKRKVWAFQKEWRYWLYMTPMGLKESQDMGIAAPEELGRRLNDKTAKLPYDRFFLDLSDKAISEMEIIFGPRMSQAEKILAEHLLRANNLEGHWHDSILRIR